MDIIKRLNGILKNIVDSQYGCVDCTVAFETTKDIKHGEFTTNIAMVLSKKLGSAPRDIAAVIVGELILCSEVVSSAIVAGSGFINIVLSNNQWNNLILSVIADDNYGYCDAGKSVKVNIEYVSANPTGPMHIGHTRGAILGDVLAQSMEAIGYEVTKEYYVNDAGSQVDTLVASALLRYREALGQDIGEIPSGMYPGEYLKAVGLALKEQFGDTLLTASDAPEVVRPIVLSMMMQTIKVDLEKLRVKHDVFTSEGSIVRSGAVEEAVERLRNLGLVYEDYLEKPKHRDGHWESRKQLLFRSTLATDDDLDRALTKEDGSWTYFAADIGYNYDKIRRGYKKLFLILGRDHIGYVKRLRSAIMALGDVEVTIMLYHLVNLMRGEEVIKMSKRQGNFLTAQDVIEVIGPDVTRFVMLSRSNDVILDFDLEQARDASKDNPLFYIQYACARAHSILRRAPEYLDKTIDMGLISTEEERVIMRSIAEWPNQLLLSAEKHEPHRIVLYLQSLAKAFHAFWNVGRASDEMRFIIPDNLPLTASRLALTRAVIKVIESGLRIMKVSPAEEM